MLQNQTLLSQQRLSSYATVNNNITHTSTPKSVCVAVCSVARVKRRIVFTFIAKGLTCLTLLTSQAPWFDAVVDPAKVQRRTHVWQRATRHTHTHTHF